MQGIQKLFGSNLMATLVMRLIMISEKRVA